MLSKLGDLQKQYQIGHNIRNARVSRQIRQEDLAESASLSQTLLSRLECGRVVLTIDTLIKICNALKVSADEILGLDFSSKNNT